MAERVVNFSDISGNMIQKPEEDLVKVTVFEHPEIEEPVQLETTVAEIEQVGKLALTKIVEIEVKMPGEDEEPQRYVLTQANFAKLAGEKPMKEVLEDAKEVDIKRVTVAGDVGLAAMNGARKEVRDHSSIDWAGTPHKGKTSPEEASMVRRNLDAVNARLAEQGLRTIDPKNPDHARRYGFPIEEAPAATAAEKPAAS